MKKAIPALLLALIMVLSGCASILERDYLVITPYDPNSVGSNPSALRVENYQDLVDAIFQLVSEGEEHGILNLYNYAAQDVDTDLARACREIITEDPLGAYAVDYIKHDSSFIVSYHEANIYITYRRTPEQVNSIVSVTGANAIRQELSKTLSGFSTEAVLHISYFAEDEEYIRNLVRQAYYDSPVTALGIPAIEVSLYPSEGFQRIAEINLTYSESPFTLRRRSQELTELALSQIPPAPSAESLYATLNESLVYKPDGAGTAYDALSGNAANSESAALAYKLLCDQSAIDCSIVQGELDGLPHFWNIVLTDQQVYQHVDLSAGLFSLSDSQLTATGTYNWNRTESPSCPDVEIEKEISN